MGAMLGFWSGSARFDRSAAMTELRATAMPSAAALNRRRYASALEELLIEAAHRVDEQAPGTRRRLSLRRS
jgi:hypothetical protein